MKSLTDNKNVMMNAGQASLRASSTLAGAPNDNFVSDPLKRYFRRSGVALKLYSFILGSAIIFLCVRSF